MTFVTNEKENAIKTMQLYVFVKIAICLLLQWESVEGSQIVFKLYCWTSCLVFFSLSVIKIGDR